jgi:hypothetical protein
LPAEDISILIFREFISGKWHQRKRKKNENGSWMSDGVDDWGKFH